MTCLGPLLQKPLNSRAFSILVRLNIELDLKNKRNKRLIIYFKACEFFIQWICQKFTNNIAPGN